MVYFLQKSYNGSMFICILPGQNINIHRRPFVHLDYTFQDKVSKAVIEARQKTKT